MTLIEFVTGLGSGMGTELGFFNIFLVSVVAWLLTREHQRLKEKIDPVYKRDVSRLLDEHDAMYKSTRRLTKKFFDEHDATVGEVAYRKRQSSSGSHKLDDVQAIVAMVTDAMRKG
jgi:hypothetical protein